MVNVLCSQAPERKAAQMTRIELELERYLAGDGEAPHVLGSMSVEGAAPAKFVGWMALLALLEKSVETPPLIPPPPIHSKRPEDGQ